MAAIEFKRPPGWLKVLLFLHVIAITIWALPVPKAVLDGERKPFGTEWILVANQKYLKTFQPVPAYLFVTGFWQYWDMFSPNPTHKDQWCDADVVYQDGSTKRYQYPRIYLMSLPQKYISERYRKFFERAGSKDYSFLWPVFAQRIASLNDDPKNPPVVVRLHLHTREVMPPGIPQRPEYADSMYFQYLVDQKQLAKTRGSLWISGGATP